MAQTSNNFGRTIQLGEVNSSHDTLEPDLFYSGRICNISNGGLNFESDCLLRPNEVIKIRLPFIADNQKFDTFQLHGAIVKWSEKPQHFNVRNAYGIEFFEPLQDVEKFIPLATAKKPRLSLSIVPGIIGFSVFLLYCIKNIFFDPKPIPEPFKLLVVGFILLGSSKFIKAIYKAPKTRSR